jgi:hypothetical protein
VLSQWYRYAMVDATVVLCKLSESALLQSFLLACMQAFLRQASVHNRQTKNVSTTSELTVGRGRG